MEIYLDANATTPVLPQASAAALAVMSGNFGNPSSVHGSGLRARAVVDAVRATARRVLGAPQGQLVFMSGATEGIQMAVLSALSSWRARRDRGDTVPALLLYGATEHKAVPEALRHWNTLLKLDLAVQAIPVGPDGRHDLAWLRARAPHAALVCTMAANNETGVISDLEGIQAALAAGPALWLVDSVQALGKLPLRLGERPIDYAPFSGHKLYAPKGIGLLYVREGAPVVPLLAGGGQEGALRSGTENMPGVAALGAVLELLENGQAFQSAATLAQYHQRLVWALEASFEGIVFNADPRLCLPTTLNFSVPGVPSKVLLDLFDAAGLRVSGGSACGASTALPSAVLQAMGLAPWRCSAAVRLSFGPATDVATIDAACERIRACGASLRESCLTSVSPEQAAPPEPITRHVVDGAVCYLLADTTTRRCVVIDPLPQLTQTLVQWIRCRNYTLAAVLDTHAHGDHVSGAENLWNAVPDPLCHREPADALGWPLRTDRLTLGSWHLSRLPLPGHTRDSTAYLLFDGAGLLAAFVGDTVMPGALGRSDFDVSDPLAFGPSLSLLDRMVGRQALLLPAHDYDDRFACTLGVECSRQPLLAAVLDGRLDAAAFAAAKDVLERGLSPTVFQTMACGAPVDADGERSEVELQPGELLRRIGSGEQVLLVDVREPYERRLGQALPSGLAGARGATIRCQSAPLSSLLNALPVWLSADQHTSVVFVCRSGNRSAQAARALRRLGSIRTWSLAGGLALWPQAAGALEGATA